jgi:hypothetical protein
VDATGPGNFATEPGKFTFGSLGSPVENFPQLYDIIRSSYVLLLDMSYCGTPRTRIFVSRTRLSDLSQEKVQTIRKASACLQDSGDLNRLLSLLG